MPTLAELRARTGPKALPKATRTVTLVEGQHLLDESRQLHEELTDLLVEAERATPDGEEQTGPRRKMGESALPPRAEEIKTAQKAIFDRLGEHQGELGLSGMSGGDWQRWKDDHPPREKNQADLALCGGLCSSSDLFDALGEFVSTWDGDPVAEGDWAGWLAESITYADRRDLVSVVVTMHEEGVARAPKSRSASPETETSGSA